jgi:ABC-type thiamine transport system substrate-binding protein
VTINMTIIRNEAGMTRLSELILSIDDAIADAVWGIDNLGAQPIDELTDRLDELGTHIRRIQREFDELAESVRDGDEAE